MKILVTTSTFPASDADEVPAFVKEQAVALKEYAPELDIVIHAPHNHYSGTASGSTQSDFYREHRFHYFWPHRLELLAGRGILPTLRAHRLLYLQIPFLIIFQFLSLWRLTRRERPDLIYAHWFTPQAITTALVSKLTGVPFLFTTHASDVSVLAGIPLSRWLVRQVCKRARCFTAVSERTAEKLRSVFGEQEWHEHFSAKLTIIPMGVDVQAPSASAEALARTKRKFALDERPILLYLGRLAEKKGVTFLLQAVSQLSGDVRRKVRIVIAGDGQLKRDLETQASELGLENVVFTGFVHGEEKAALFTLADYLCLPSIIDSTGDSEGFPVVLMEGLAAGKVILASDVSGGEVVLTDGDNGFLFRQKSPERLAGTLARVLKLGDDQLHEISAKSRQLSEQFSWAIIARRYYEQLVAAANAGN